MFTIIYIYQKIGNSSGDIGVHVSMWRNTETIRNETIDSDILWVSIKNHTLPTCSISM